MSSNNFASYMICSECSNSKMIGIDFEKGNKELEENIKVYSFCVYKHEKKDQLIEKISLNDLFLKDDNNKMKCELKINCEYCNENPIHYHCLDCKRNICINCFKYHKTHKHYFDKDYISEIELEKIKNKFDKSKSTIEINLSLIEKQINNYELQLKDLKELYEKYKNINDKLIKISKYILEQYNSFLKSKESIPYPFYFNIKNILLFNPHKLKLPKNDISIKSFADFLNGKISSNFYFLIKNSNFSQNLHDYNKFAQESINLSIIDLNEFKKSELLYDNFIYFNEDKIFGISYNLDEKRSSKSQTEIYNIKDNCIETIIKDSPEKIFYNKEYNLLIFMSNLCLKIMNPINFKIIENILANKELEEERSKTKRHLWSYPYNDEETEKSFRKFLYMEFISKDYIGIIFEGNIKYLGKNYEDLYISNNLKIINMDDESFEEDKYEDYIHFILYKNENNKFIPKKVIPLIKNKITISDVSYITGKHCEYHLPEIYCEFYFDSLNIISKEELIIAFKSRIKENREHSYYFINDRFYKNETIYYLLNFEKDNTIQKKIGSTKEKSYLFKNKDENNFYFFYGGSEKCAEKLNTFFHSKGLNLNTIKFEENEKLNARNIIIRKNIIIGWNKNILYLGIIYNNSMEIIQTFNFNEEKEKIRYVSLAHNCIFDNFRKDYNVFDEKQENTFIEEVLYKHKYISYLNKNSEDDDADIN